MPEISDADYELLQLSKTALGGKTRMKALRVFKEASPDTILHEVDTEDRIAAALNPLQEENKKLREDLDKRTTTELLEKKRAAIAAKGLDVSAVEKIMVERGIQNHETAAEFLAMNSRPAAPATATWDRSATVPSNDGLKKNPAAWAREEASKVITELQAAKRQ